MNNYTRIPYDANIHTRLADRWRVKIPSLPAVPEVDLRCNEEMPPSDNEENLVPEPNK